MWVLISSLSILPFLTLTKGKILSVLVSVMTYYDENILTLLFQMLYLNSFALFLKASQKCTSSPEFLIKKRLKTKLILL